jgi:hypothetical protein
MRGEALAELEAQWEGIQGLSPNPEIRLHYLSGRIEVELLLPLSGADPAQANSGLQEDLEKAAAEVSWFGGVRILYNPHHNGA